MSDYLQYGALGVLALVLVGIAAGGRMALTFMAGWLERLLDVQKEAYSRHDLSLNQLHEKIDEHAEKLHIHLSESERRLDAAIAGRKPTPPPMKSFGRG